MVEEEQLAFYWGIGGIVLGTLTVLWLIHRPWFADNPRPPWKRTLFISVIGTVVALLLARRGE